VLDAPVTEAVNCCVPDSVTVVELGEIEIDAAVPAPVPVSVVVPDELVLPVPPVPGEDGVLPTISGEGLMLPPAPDELLAAVASIPRPHPDNKRQSDKTARGTAATQLQRASFRIIHHSCESASGQKPRLIHRFGNTVQSCS
jgi:hypothetical protein